MAKHLFQRRLLLVTGKGGVGKTSIAAALAVAARDHGKRVLLIQLGRMDNIGPIFDKSLPPYEIIELDRDLFAFTIDPFLALREYLIGSLRMKFIVERFLKTKVIQYLTQAAPGWRELITIGKIWQIQDQTLGYRNKPLYDLLVVDAPATGHGISFLRVPAIILNTIKFGPIRRHTLEVQKLLLDPDRTLLVGVTLPEEMPVNEVAEIHQAAHEVLHIPYGATVLNAYTPPVEPALRPLLDRLLRDDAAMQALGKGVPGGRERLRRALEIRESRAALSELYLQEITQRLGGNILRVPLLADAGLNRESIARLARLLDDQIIGEPS